MGSSLASQLRLVSKSPTAGAETHATVGSSLSVAGLFAGIGGIELGLSRAGHEAVLLCEMDPAASAVLDEHFPRVPKIRDVRDIDSLPRNVDMVAAGFPCQDLSQAGQTAGISGTRSGLVGEVFRLLEQRRTEWVLLENVSFMLQLGRGRALDVIITQLERLNYRWAYRVVNSNAFGVPQRRERVFILASLHHDPRSVLLVDDAGQPEATESFRQVACGFYWTEGLRGLGWAVNAVPTLKGGSTIGIPSPPAIIFPSGRIATPDLRDAERMQGFPPDWTLPAESISRRTARWKLVGNAVTVEAAGWIGRRLREPAEYEAAADLPLRAGGRWPRAAWNDGNGRHAAIVSSWPTRERTEPLQAFLRFPLRDLSAKATAGFLSRARQAKLKFPEGFLEAVEAHLDRVTAAAPARAII